MKFGNSHPVGCCAQGKQLPASAGRRQYGHPGADAGQSIEVTAALKGLRLYGMAAAWADLNAQGGPGAVDSGRWLVEHLLQAETTDRAVRSVNYQMGAAKFPAHRDLASFPEFDTNRRKCLIRIGQPFGIATTAASVGCRWSVS